MPNSGGFLYKKNDSNRSERGPGVELDVEVFVGGCDVQGRVSVKSTKSTVIK